VHGRESVPGLNNPVLAGDVSVITSLLELYAREAAAHVQPVRVKAVAVVLIRLINSRSPEKSGDRLLLGSRENEDYIKTNFRHTISLAGW